MERRTGRVRPVIFPEDYGAFLDLHAQIVSCRSAADFDLLLPAIHALTPHTNDLMRTWYRCRLARLGSSEGR